MKCWFWHSWERWRETSRADLRMGEKVVGRCIIQQRQCKTCGFTQHHVDRIWVDDRPVDKFAHFERIWNRNLTQWP